MEDQVLRFSATLRGSEDMDVLSIEFPYDVEALYGTRGQVKVKATYDGVPYRGSLAKMGHPCHFLIVTKAIRMHLGGKKAGDTVQVTVQRDTEPRVVDVPDDLGALLEPRPELKAYFDGLAYTHQKEYVRWITEAKKTETRERRLHKTIEMLESKKKNPSDK